MCCDRLEIEGVHTYFFEFTISLQKKHLAFRHGSWQPRGFLSCSKVLSQFQRLESAFSFSSETCLFHLALSSFSACTTTPQQQAAELLCVLSCFMLFSHKQICFLSRVLPHCVEAMKGNEALKKTTAKSLIFCVVSCFIVESQM